MSLSLDARRRQWDEWSQHEGAEGGELPARERQRLASPSPGRARRAADREVDRVQRGGRADEQPVALGAAEADVGDDLGDGDLAEQRAVGGVAVDAVARAGPQVAVDVEPEAVEQADVAGLEHLAARQR